MAVPPLAEARPTCTEAPFFVRGSSLAPFIHDGETVMGRLGADCGDPARGELVLFTHLGLKVPLLKIVLGIPGDRFGLAADGGSWSLLINGAVAANAEGMPYRLGPGNDYMLRLYLKGTHGTIPPNTWLVMGDNPAGTDDSSRFGLIMRADVLGIAARPVAVQ
jgi:signal peptidase I